MKPNIPALAFLASVIAVLPLRAEPAAPPMPPELRLLDPFAGNWRYDFTVYQSEWSSEEKHGAGTFTCGWTLGNRFMEEQGTESDGSSHRKIYTYDTMTKTYRAWWFSSIGIFNDSTGRWDAEQHSFVFTTVLATGPRGTTTLHFTGDKTVEWDVTFKDDAGKIYYHSGGKSVRQ